MRKPTLWMVGLVVVTVFAGCDLQGKAPYYRVDNADPMDDVVAEADAPEPMNLGFPRRAVEFKPTSQLETMLPPILSGSEFMGECPIEKRWEHTNGNYDVVYGSPNLAVSPNQALLMRWGGGPATYFRMSDGTYLGQDSWMAESVFDDQWQIRVDSRYLGDGYEFQISSARSGSVEGILPTPTPPDRPEAYINSTRVIMAPGGEHLALLACFYDPAVSSSLVRVRGYDLNTGNAGPVVEVVGDCHTAIWPSSSPAALSTDGSTLILSFSDSSVLHSIQLASGEVHSVDAMDGKTAIEPFNGFDAYDRQDILAVAISPDNSQVAASNVAGEITFHDAVTLAPINRILKTAYVGINEYTYGPSVESPLAYNPSGNRLAHLDETGEAVVTDLHSGETLLTFPRPEIAQEQYASPHALNPATAFAFDADGKGLLIAWEFGVSYWRCLDAPDPDFDAVLENLTVEGPSQAMSQDVNEWAVTSKNSGQPVVHQFFFNTEQNEAPVQANLTGEFSLQSYTPGTFDVQFVVDDGVRRLATEGLTLTVTE